MQSNTKENDKDLRDTELYILFIRLFTNVQKNPILFKFKNIQNNNYNIRASEKNYAIFDTYKRYLPLNTNKLLKNLFKDNVFEQYNYIKKSSQKSNKSQDNNISTIELEETDTKKNYYIYDIQGNKTKIKIHKYKTESDIPKDEKDKSPNNFKLTNLETKDFIKNLNNNKQYELNKKSYSIIDYYWDGKYYDGNYFKIDDDTYNINTELFIFNKSIKEKKDDIKETIGIQKAIRSSLNVNKDRRTDIQDYKYNKNYSTDNAVVYINEKTNTIFYYVDMSLDKYKNKKDVNIINKVDLITLLNNIYPKYKILDIHYIDELDNFNKLNYITIDNKKYKYTQNVNYITKDIKIPESYLKKIFIKELYEKTASERSDLTLPNNIILDRIDDCEFVDNIDNCVVYYMLRGTNIIFQIKKKRDTRISKDVIESYPKNDFRYITYILQKNDIDNIDTNINKYFINVNLLLSSKEQKYKLDASGNILRTKDGKPIIDDTKFKCKYHKYEFMRIFDKVKDMLSYGNAVDKSKKLIKSAEDSIKKPNNELIKTIIDDQTKKPSTKPRNRTIKFNKPSNKPSTKPRNRTIKIPKELKTN